MQLLSGVDKEWYLDLEKSFMATTLISSFALLDESVHCDLQHIRRHYQGKKG